MDSGANAIPRNALFADAVASDVNVNVVPVSITRTSVFDAVSVDVAYNTPDVGSRMSPRNPAPAPVRACRPCSRSNR